MQYLILAINIVILLAIIGLLFFYKYYFPSYMSKKGEDLATREDIAAITHEIEKTRLVYIEQQKLFEAELQKKIAIHGLTCEREFQILSAVWEKLVELRIATQNLRSEFSSVIENGKTEDQTKKERIESFNKVFNPFWDIVQKNKPFYPIKIHNALLNIIELTLREEIQYNHSSPIPQSKFYCENYWDNAVKNNDAILKKIDEICDNIRERISST